MQDFSKLHEIKETSKEVILFWRHSKMITKYNIQEK